MMRKILTSVSLLLSLCVFGQKNPTKEAQPIVEEGKLLYKSEMASWYGTDLFLENYKDKTNIGGYFSYTENDITKCIFFSKSENPKVIGTISFDNTYNIKTAKIDLSERAFSKTEKDLYQIRKITETELHSDTLFKFYKNTSLNAIPLINKHQKKVYLLTGTEENGVVIFGNDYLVTFDKENKLLNKKRLHQNVIPIHYGKEEEDTQIEGAIHNHSSETGDFITATDICTLMLYEKFTKWKNYVVVSQKYLNSWDCETDQLTVIAMDTIKQINKDQENRIHKEDK